MLARFETGENGIVIYPEVNPNYTRRPDTVELLRILDGRLPLDSKYLEEFMCL